MELDEIKHIKTLSAGPDNIVGTHYNSFNIDVVLASLLSHLSHFSVDLMIFADRVPTVCSTQDWASIGYSCH